MDTKCIQRNGGWSKPALDAVSSLLVHLGLWLCRRIVVRAEMQQKENALGIVLLPRSWTLLWTKDEIEDELAHEGGSMPYISFPAMKHSLCETCISLHRRMFFHYYESAMENEIVRT